MASSNRNNSGKEIDPGLVARVSGALRYAITGKAPAWFGPMEPLAPIAPPETAGRQFDYENGYNLKQKPRIEESISFEHMRGLADNLDILRLVIETRKDQLAAMKWAFKPKDKDAEPDARCDELNEFFLQPDKEHSWADWLRMILEDLFVLDAPAVYPRKTKGGKIYSFEVIDGATIKRVIDAGGRTPLPPEPAYQQVLKGVPAVNYTREELLYKPSNPRANKVYGYSRVEQIIMTVNIAIRRQISQLSYYTDGSTPDMLFGCPVEWNADQIKQFQSYWDEILLGNTQARRGARFIPAGVDPINTKETLLKDTYDEWLARIVCYAFSVSPTPFIKETNRATAETALEAARAEGLLPLMNWVSDLINLIVVKYFGYADIVFEWLDSTELDPLIKAQVAQIYISSKVLTPDEVRHADLAMPPLTPQQKEELTPPLPTMLDENGNPQEEPQSKKFLAAAMQKTKKIKPINRERKAVTAPRAKLKKAIQAAFAKSLSAVIAQAAKSETGLITKGKTPDISEIDLQPVDDLNVAFENALVPIAKDGATLAFVQIDYDVDEALEQASETAIAWAKNRAAELVGKRIDESGNIVDNPNAKYRISDTTREGINSLVTQATEAGWTNDQLANALSESYAFSAQRADMIARTETAFADTNGNMIAYRESGVVMGKQWLLAPDSCDECQANAAQGVIGLDEDFQDGSDAAPAHPRCVCDCAPVVSED